MSLVLTTDYATFYINKRGTVPPTIREMLGFRLISGKNRTDIAVGNYENFIYFETISNNGKKDANLRVYNTHWALIDTDNESFHHDSDIINTLLIDDETPVDIEMPQGYSSIKDAIAFKFEQDKHLDIDIPDSDYIIDYELHNDKINEHQLNIKYFNVISNPAYFELFDDFFDKWLDSDRKVDFFYMKLDSDRFKLTGIQDFIDYYKIPKQTYQQYDAYTLDKSGKQFFELLDSLKNISIQYNISNPTTDKKISLYDLLQHSLKSSDGIDLKIGNYSIKIDYAYVVLAIGIKIQIADSL